MQMRIGFCKNWLLFVALIVLMVGCESNAKRVNRTLEILTTVPIRFEENNFVVWCNGMNGRAVCEDKALFKMVCFVDSQECSPCMLKDAYLWNSYVRTFSPDEVAFLYVISAKKVDDVKLQIRESGFSRNFYIDTLGKFKHDNPQIPESSVYHTFLIDKNQNVILVGNPAKNRRIEKLFFEIINKEFKTDYSPL